MHISLSFVQNKKSVKCTRGEKVEEVDKKGIIGL